MKAHRYTQFPFPFVIPLFNIIGVYFLVSGIVSALASITGKISFDTGFNIFYGFMAIFVSNAYPAIDADEDGLFVHFSFFRLRVKWNDILDIRPISLLYGSYVVRTKVLTPFHRLYGLYTLSFQPSFVVHSLISGFPKLYASIKNKRLIHTNAEVVA
jgi:hypothetical protein